MPKITSKEIMKIIAQEKADLSARRRIGILIDLWPLTIVTPVVLILIVLGQFI